MQVRCPSCGHLILLIEPKGMCRMLTRCADSKCRKWVEVVVAGELISVQLIAKPIVA